MIIELDDLSKELCELRVCALCGGQRGGSGSQFVVGFTLPRILLIFIKPLRLILLSLRVEYY